MLMYSNGLATTNPTLYDLQTVFTKKTGYNSAVTIDKDNQFITKKYFEDNQTGGSRIENSTTPNPGNASVDCVDQSLVRVRNSGSTICDFTSNMIECFQPLDMNGLAITGI